MKTLMLFSPAAIAAALPAHAQSSRTVTVDRPNYEGTRVVERDGEGSISRDTDVTRKSDGATASRDYDRTVSADGWSASGSQTGFNGKTRSFEASKVRGNGQSNTVGTATGRNGGTVDYAGNRTRTDTGYTASQSLTTGSGRELWARDKSVSRVDGRVNKSVDVSRASGFTRNRAVNRAGIGRRR